MAKLIFLIVAVSLIGWTLAQSNHFQIGSILPGDRLLFSLPVKKSSSWLQIVSTDVYFPPKGSSNNANIHFIRALDRDTKGKGGYASLYAGGINQKFVQVHFKSQRSQGIDFNLEIWGQ